jgi:ATP-binding cassette subfamily B (MDR/TAP) protein 1
MSEKVALIVSFVGSFLTGFIVAYVRNWRLALALTSMVPFMAASGAVMNIFLAKYMQ